MSDHPDVAAGWVGVRGGADTTAARLRETLLPADVPAAGIRFEWTEQR